MTETNAQGASTLTEVMAAYEADGFEGQLGPRDGGMVSCSDCGQISDAARLQVEDERRLEGVSDPDEMAMVMATRCPQCRKPSTLVVHYGPAAGQEDTDVLTRMRGEV